MMLSLAIVLNVVANVGAWSYGGGGMGGAAVRPLARTARPYPSASPRRTVRVAPLAMNSQELASMRGLAKEKMSEISRLEKMIRDEREALLNAQERIKVLTGGGGQVMKETALRSLAKAVGWRLTAGVVTFSTSLYFTKGDYKTALTIVGSDFISKSGTMYIGERLFNKVQVGRSKSGGDNPMRSVIKALIWRLFAAFNTMVVSVFLVKKASVGAKIAGADSIIKTSLMIMYDQAWSKIDWGRELENVGGDGI